MSVRYDESRVNQDTFRDYLEVYNIILCKKGR